MYGFTVIGRDGDEAYMSEAEYESFQEAFSNGEEMMCDMNEGSFEVWREESGEVVESWV